MTGGLSCAVLSRGDMQQAGNLNWHRVWGLFGASTQTGSRLEVELRFDRPTSSTALDAVQALSLGAVRDGTSAGTTRALCLQKMRVNSGGNPFAVAK